MQVPLPEQELLRPKRIIRRNRKPETRRFLEHAVRQGLDPNNYPPGEHRVWHAATWALVAQRDFLRDMAKLQELKRDCDDEHGDERRRIIRQLQWHVSDLRGADRALRDFLENEEAASESGNNRLWHVGLRRFVTSDEIRAKYLELKRRHWNTLTTPLVLPQAHKKGRRRGHEPETALTLALDVPIDDTWDKRAKQLQHELSERIPFPDKPTDEDIAHIARRLQHLSSELGLIIRFR